MITSSRWPFRAALIALTLSALGCSAKPIYKAEKLHSEGQYTEAADSLAPYMVDEDEDNALDKIEAHNTLWAYLEYGKMQQDAGRFEESTRSFQNAIDLFDSLNDEEIISLSGAGNNLGSILTDDRNRDYLGAYYDYLGAHIAQAINYLMLGRYEEASTHARVIIDHADQNTKISKRLELFRQKMEAESDEMVEGAESAEAEEQTPTRTVERAFEDQRLQERIAALEAASDPLYADGFNPYGFFVGGVSMLASRNPGEAADYFSRLNAVAGRDLLERLARGRDLDDLVVVFFENGRAPARADGSIDVIGIRAVPLPVIEERPEGRASKLVVSAGVRSAEAVELANIDAIVAADFRERLLEIWGRPILSQAIKATAAYFANSAVRNEDAFVRIATGVASFIWISSAEPDLRSWRTLPGRQGVAVIERPGDGRVRLTLRGPGGELGASSTVDLADAAGPAFVFVRSTDAGSLAVYVDRMNQRPADSLPAVSSR